MLAIIYIHCDDNIAFILLTLAVNMVTTARPLYWIEDHAPSYDKPELSILTPSM